MTTFYVFNRDPFGSHDAHMSVYDEPARHGEAPRCPKCNRFVGMLPALPPIRAELELYGHYFGDVAFTGHQLLVSAKLRDVFIQSQFTGLSDFFPVEVTAVKSRKRKLRNDCPVYFLASISRSRAAIDTKASGFEWEGEPNCPECRQGDIIKRWSRILIEPNTWTGEDVFYPRGLSVILVTEKFRDTYLGHGLRNGIFIPAAEYGHDFYPWERKSRSASN
jgi:ssDNA-binding Zn-finger/Zn-ribbon topoisomerase 1